MTSIDSFSVFRLEITLDVIPVLLNPEKSMTQNATWTVAV